MAATKTLVTKTIDLGDVELSCTVHGDGPLVLCAHGFPDDARSFRAQIDPLVARGFRVACPTMRGYAPSGIPKSRRYDAEALGHDLCALADRLSPGSPVRLVGHDWGAVAAYAATALAPARFSHLVTIAVPHLRATLPRLAQPAQLRRSWYIAYFQLRGVAERGLAKNDFALIDRLWRDWSPGYAASREDLDLIKAGIAPRVSEVIGYYRAFFSSRVLLGEARRLLFTKTTVPAIHMHGEDDGCIGVELARGVEERHFLAGIRVHTVPRAGHFVHLERPEVVNPILLDFLGAP
ncbi:alpha/beta fold hydrolase [Polyangium sorediatum]|uniref:Alpha/beta hydrolase n=1 Tax=Polyangium sorediatum TaxID=889274 RepID=A0ABT6NRK7_9BACT|nr:alpha/beta hydrolase [Polyangium sorediatum]MDI1430805.1 alpha/beta hydrolase [Polyangium sorediatum]